MKWVKAFATYNRNAMIHYAGMVEDGGAEIIAKEVLCGKPLHKNMPEPHRAVENWKVTCPKCKVIMERMIKENVVDVDVKFKKNQLVLWLPPGQEKGEEARIVGNTPVRLAYDNGIGWMIELTYGKRLYVKEGELR